jgi:hypothetical protein
MITFDQIISSLTLLGVGSLITLLVKDKLDKNNEARIKLRESKEQQYKNLLTNILGFFQGWEDYEAKNEKTRKKQFMWEVYTSVPLYATDEVIRLCYEFIESHNKKSTTKLSSDEIYSKIVLAIRKELNETYGQSETELKSEDIKVLQVD